MKQVDEVFGVFLFTTDGQIIGHADDTRLRNAKRWQRIIARISRRYRFKFIDPKPFSARIGIRHETKTG